MKQKAKRLSAFVLASAIILSLTACTENNTSVTSNASINESVDNSEGTSENNSDKNENATAQNTPNKVDDTLPQCEPANTVNFFTHNVMKGINGYYYRDSWDTGYDNMSSGIVYYDIPTGKTIPLCSKPQCPHDGNAFCPSTSFDSHFNILYNGYIYRFGNFINNENQYELKLMKTDLMGNELSLVSDVMTNVGGYISVHNVVVHYGKMIFVLESQAINDGIRTPYIIDLASGEYKEIYIPEPANGIYRWQSHALNHLICDGDWLYYTIREVTLKSDKLGFVESNYDYNRTEMFRYNLKSGETEVVAAMPDIYSSFTVNNGIIYYTVADRKNNTFSLYAYDVEKSNVTTLAQNVRQKFVDGKYVGDTNKVTVMTDRQYIYICTSGNYRRNDQSASGDDIDFYIYDFDGKELLHGLPDTGLDLSTGEWEYSFSALDGDIYIRFVDGSFSPYEEEDKLSGTYMIKTEDLINGGTEWTKLYKATK